MSLFAGYVSSAVEVKASFLNQRPLPGFEQPKQTNQVSNVTSQPTNFMDDYSVTHLNVVF